MHMHTYRFLFLSTEALRLDVAIAMGTPALAKLATSWLAPWQATISSLNVFKFVSHPSPNSSL
jgi:hypothetical protein